MSLKRARIRIEGRVQGVYYRASMKEAALQLGVTGWVRNLAGGEVEALVEGEQYAIESLIDWCWQGPPASAVDDVFVEWEPAKGGFDSFNIKR